MLSNQHIMVAPEFRKDDCYSLPIMRRLATYTYMVKINQEHLAAGG